VANPVRQAEYVRTLAERFSLAEDAIRQRLRSKGRGRTAGKAQPPLEARPERARERAERLLLHLMIHEPSLRRGVAARLGPDDFADPVHRAVAVALFTAPDEESERLRERLNEGEQAMFLRMLFEDPPVEEKDTQKVVDDAISYLAEREPAALRRDALAKEIQIAAAAGDSEKVRSLQMQYLKLVGTTDAKEG
jgi:DNA primase